VLDERAPAAAHVEEPLPRGEAELAADEIELRALRLLEPLPAGREVRARVDHARVEEQPVEVVRHVVVVPDGLAVARDAVEAPAQAGLERRRAAVAERAARPRRERGRGEGEARTRPAPARGRLDERDGVSLELERAVDVRLREPVLRGGREERLEHLGRAEHHRPADPGVAGGREDVAVPEPHRERPRPGGEQLRGNPSGVHAT
jgi:hypothetical protein